MQPRKLGGGAERGSRSAPLLWLLQLRFPLKEQRDPTAPPRAKQKMLAVLGEERGEARSLSSGCFINDTDDLFVITVPASSHMQSYSSHGGGAGPQLTADDGH